MKSLMTILFLSFGMIGADRVPATVAGAGCTQGCCGKVCCDKPCCADGCSCPDCNACCGGCCK